MWWHHLNILLSTNWTNPASSFRSILTVRPSFSYPENQPNRIKLDHVSWFLLTCAPSGVLAIMSFSESYSSIKENLELIKHCVKHEGLYWKIKNVRLHRKNSQSYPLFRSDFHSSQTFRTIPRQLTSAPKRLNRRLGQLRRLSGPGFILTKTI